MKGHLQIDYEEHKIIMSVAFAKNAKISGSKDFLELQNVHNSFPDYIITTREITANPNKEAYKGLTFEYMEKYILSHPHSTENLKDFNEMRLLAKCHSVRFPHIKKWFLSTYPEVEEFKLYKEDTQNKEII
jgi:hypothetical protein